MVERDGGAGERSEMRWRTLLEAAAIGGFVVAALPVAARSGDPLVLGERDASWSGTVLRSHGARTPKLTADAAHSVPLELSAPQGNPPLRVDSQVKVDGFNADLVNGMDSVDFADAGPDRVGAYLAVDGTAADSDLLDGHDSGVFLPMPGGVAVAHDGLPLLGADCLHAGGSLLGFDGGTTPICSTPNPTDAGFFDVLDVHGWRDGSGYTGGDGDSRPGSAGGGDGDEGEGAGLRPRDRAGRDTRVGMAEGRYQSSLGSIASDFDDLLDHDMVLDTFSDDPSTDEERRSVPPCRRATPMKHPRDAVQPLAGEIQKVVDTHGLRQRNRAGSRSEICRPEAARSSGGSRPRMCAAVHRLSAGDVLIP